MNPKKMIKGLFIAIGVLFLVLIFEFIRIQSLNSDIKSLSQKVSLLETNLSSTTDEIKGSVAKTQETFANAINQNVGSIEQKLGSYRQEVSSVYSTVNTLQKLSKTDPELLKKYSKVFFLSDNYAPANLIEVPEAYKYSNNKFPQIHGDVWTFVQKMIDDAKREGIEIYVSSGYRSFSEQKALKGIYTINYGAGSANQFSADQGYSEHQLGTTIDFITPGLGGNVDGFENTKAFTWLKNNAHRYGFILSYPLNNKYYVFEPWHWRFVGIKLATDLFNQGKNFYDLEQRVIDEYLVNIFDK